MGLDEKREFGDERCGLIRGDEEVNGLENHSGQGGGCKIRGKVSNKTNPVGCERVRGEGWWWCGDIDDGGDAGDDESDDEGDNDESNNSDDGDVKRQDGGSLAAMVVEYVWVEK